MRVKVRLFAALRETVGRPQLEVEVPDPATPELVWSSLVAGHPALARHRPSLAAAVNRGYARFDAALAEGDEVVFIPPVSGG